MMTKRVALHYGAVAAALLFIAFIVGVIIIADRADGPPFWSFINRIPWGDKVGHLGLIGTLSFLCNLAFRTRKWRYATLTTMVLLVLLTGEELSQAFVPSRHLDLFDWLADLVGLALGQWMAYGVRAFLTKRVAAG